MYSGYTRVAVFTIYSQIAACLPLPPGNATGDATADSASPRRRAEQPASGLRRAHPRGVTAQALAAALLVACAALLAAAGCRVNTSYDDTQYQCPDGVCPAGYDCQAGQCVRADGVADASPAPPDAPIDAAPEPLPEFDAAPEVADPALGNVAYFSFDRDYRPGEVVHDRGPYAFVAEVNGPNRQPARHGDGRNFIAEDDEHLRLPDADVLFLQNRLTIEAWVNPSTSRDQAIFSDFDFENQPQTEYSFEITQTGALAFFSNAGCNDTSQAAITDTVTIENDVFSHVAVTWDGQSVRFYVDAELRETQPFVHIPCEFNEPRTWHIGRRNDGSRDFDGVIDEFKVSDYPKAAAELAISRDHDPTQTVSVCGDHMIEGLEQCEGDTECCDAALCSFVDDGSPCTEGSCQTGVCRQVGGRINQGLVALYEFDETTGDTISDSSNFGAPLDLTIVNANDNTLPPDITWGDGALTLNSATRARSASATKISQACVTSDAFTVEAWIAPDNNNQGGPARIVSLSTDSSNRNFTLGQEEISYGLRTRTTHTSDNGEPSAISVAGDVRSDQLTHVVGVLDPRGARRIYVNGLLRNESRIDGDLSGWDLDYVLLLGNELNADRTWLGSFHLVAIYCRALEAHEVARNYTAGANP